MISSEESLRKITALGEKLQDSEVASILIVLELKSFFIGDTLMKISDLKAVSRYWKNARIDLNCRMSEVTILTEGNPYINNYIDLPIDEIELRIYDMILVISYQEREFLARLTGKYAHELANGLFRTSVFSYSGVHFKEGEYEGSIFPSHKMFSNFLGTIPREDGELYISDQEMIWAEEWLKRNNASEEDNLIVLVDNTTHADKLLRVDYHFDILFYFLSMRKVKILIFDENNIGKEEFYKAYIQEDEQFKRIIFAKGLKLRESLSLLSSRYIKIIFGPSSGLLHCASAIYRVLRTRYDGITMPLMLAYACQYVISQEEWTWWSNSLTKCFLIVKTASSKYQIDLLIGENQVCEPCSRYTADLLISFIEKNYSLEMKTRGLINENL